MIFVVKDGMRLCKDKRWREFANFGTFKECVKIYRSRGAAVRLANSQNALLEYHNKTANVKVAEVPVGFTVNAVGDVFNAEDRQVGNLSDFTGSTKELIA